MCLSSSAESSAPPSSLCMSFCPCASMACPSVSAVLDTAAPGFAVNCTCGYNQRLHAHMRNAWEVVDLALTGNH